MPRQYAIPSEPTPSGPRTSAPVLAWERVGSGCITFALLLCAAAIAAYPFFSRAPWMAFQEDDFFYYLQIANNFAHGHGSTFNGIVATNGYHPLWFALLALNSRISSSPLTVRIFLTVCIFTATALTYFFARGLLTRHVGARLLPSALAAFIALYAMHLYVGGMEVILTIPLVLAACILFQRSWLWGDSSHPPLPARWLLFGLLLSAIFLSRLDSVLMLILLGIATGLQPGLRTRLRLPELAALTAGLVPSALYVLSNRIFFGTWMTVSGMSKQLRHSHSFSPQPWHSLLAKQHTALLTIVPSVLALAVLFVVWKQLTPAQRALYPVILIFPWLYLTALSLLSDWRLWDWYFYAMRTALTIAFAVLLTWQPVRRLLLHPAVSLLAAVFVISQIAFTRRSPAGMDDMVLAAEQIRGFAIAHPGVYAMGDRAGVVAYLLPAPLVQTEGLVMDRGFLERMRLEQPLDQVLAAYNVRYYIATAHGAYSACFRASEPFQAGPSSAHMTTTICGAPVAAWPHKDNLTTLIFDLQGSQLPPPAQH